MAFAVAAVRLSAQTVETRAVILGTVSDSGLRPVAGADVSFAGSSIHATADSLGRFRIVRVPAGRFVMVARSIGYRASTNVVEVRAGDTLRLAFTLEPAAARELATIVITERTLSNKLMEFDQRRRLGFGEFFTQADIEKINPTDISDVLRRSKAVRLRSGTAHSAREVDVCPMALYIDGVPIGTEALSYLPSPKDIAAMEVYAGSATVPVWLPKPPVSRNAPVSRNGTNGAAATGPSIDSDRTSAQLGCGAILFWTRDGSS